MKRYQLNIVFIVSCMLLLNLQLIASPFVNDSLRNVKPPKHYFHQVLYSDFYNTGKINLDTTNLISKRLKTYQISQFSAGYYVPLYTKDFYKDEGTRISNFHLLLTTNYTRLNLDMGGISKHVFTKFSMGGRALYNDGKKSILFAEFSPYSIKDAGYSYTRTLRFASTFVYNYAANPSFSFRLGYTRTLLFGNRYTLPYIGFRIGKLDGINFSIQFPRAISFNLPIGQYIHASIFTRPQGGLYTFANVDSLKIGDFNNNQKLYFGRYEFLHGLRVDVEPNTFLNFYLSGGFTTNNQILFHYAPPQNSSSPYSNTFGKQVKNTTFINIGLVFRFGQTKSINYNRQMYEALDLNNTITPGDNGSNNGNGDIPVPIKKFRIKNDDILDLVEDVDLY